MSKNLPHMQFYPGDWFKDPALRLCTLAARGVWIDMLCLMWECESRGILRTNGVAWTDEEIANSIIGPFEEVMFCLRLLEAKGVFSRMRSDKSVHSRRMVREFGTSKKRVSAGRAGGLSTQAKSKQNGEQNSSKTLIYDIDNDNGISSLKGGSGGKSKNVDPEFWAMLTGVLVPEFFGNPEFKASWAEWVNYRWTKGKKMSELAAKKIATRMKKESWSVQSAIDAIDFSIANDYQGLFAGGGKTNSRPNSSPARIRRGGYTDDMLNIHRPTD